jgi:hypothetical protein
VTYTTRGDVGAPDHPPLPSRRDASGAGGASGGAGLLVAEVHRFGSRRFIRWLLGLAVLGYLVVVPLVAVTQFGRTTDAVRDQARTEIARIVADQNRFREQCIAQPLPPDAPEGTTPEEYCGPEGDASDYRVEDFLPKRPFPLGEDLAPGALTVGAGVAALFFVIGATWIGAESSARTLHALLFWETRRLRVLTAKTVVPVGVTAVVAVLPAGQQWLLTVNAAALVLTGGVTVAVPGTAVDETTGGVVEFTERTISNLHGGLFLGGVTLTLLVLGGWLFRRRDLT